MGETSLIPVEIYEQYPEFVQCLDYLVLRRKTVKDKNGKEKKLSMAKVALLMAKKYPGYGASIPFLYDRVGEWRANGTLPAAEKFLLNRQLEEIRVAVDQIATEWPNVLLKLLDDALNGKPSERLPAARMLREEVLSAKLDQRDTGSQEKIYISRTSNFNPTDID